MYTITWKLENKNSFSNNKPNSILISLLRWELEGEELILDDSPTFSKSNRWAVIETQRGFVVSYM